MRPSKPELMMRIAELTATRSTCARAAVGCVVTNLELTNVVSMGYNGNARGLENRCDSETPGSCGCLHAEENALIKAPYGTGLVLFTSTSPCLACAKRVLNSSVRHVYYRSTYRDDAGLELLREHPNVGVQHLPDERRRYPLNQVPDLPIKLHPCVPPTERAALRLRGCACERPDPVAAQSGSVYCGRCFGLVAPAARGGET